MPQRPLRVFYAAGPGDVVGTYRHWREGRDDPSETSMTYSSQLFDLVSELDAEACVVSTHPVAGEVRDDRFHIANLPLPFSSRGWRFHFSRIFTGLRTLYFAKRFNADVIIAQESTGHWLPLRLAERLGIAIIPDIHGVLWAQNDRPALLRRLFNRWAGEMFRRTAAGILSVSNDIDEQVITLAGGKARPIYPFLPTYRRAQFADIPRPSTQRSPFRVLYVGRIDRRKGVCDLLDIARRFESEGRRDIEFDLCGDGPALEKLRDAATAAGLAIRFRCHGHCDQDALRAHYAACHVVIAPTRTDFVEGFNRVVAEAVLSGRPVITSRVCPAIEHFHEASVEVSPDDVQGYGDAVLQLCDDAALYESKVEACAELGAPFFNKRRGWGAALRRVLRDAGLIAEPTTALWQSSPARSSTSLPILNRFAG